MGGVAYPCGGHVEGVHLAGGLVDAQVQLAPRAALRPAVLAQLPLPLAVELEPAVSTTRCSAPAAARTKSVTANERARRASVDQWATGSAVSPTGVSTERTRPTVARSGSRYTARSVSMRDR
jgi:hypothetical protein